MKRHLEHQALHVGFKHFKHQTSRVRKSPRWICVHDVAHGSEPHMMCRCGMILKADSSFCRKCGTSRAELDRIAEQPPMEDEVKADRKINIISRMDMVTAGLKKMTSSPEIMSPDLNRESVIVGFKHLHSTSSVEDADTWTNSASHCSSLRERWRLGCLAVVNSLAFNLCVDFILFFSILTLIIADDQLSGANRCLRYGPWPMMDAATSILFCLEWMARAGARGVLHSLTRGIKPLIRDPWMVLELVINVSSIVHIATAVACRQSPSLTLVLRCFRSLVSVIARLCLSECNASLPWLPRSISL